MSPLTREEAAHDREGAADDARRDYVAGQYIGSDRERNDARHWIQTAELNDDETDTIVEWFRESGDHIGIIDDIATDEPGFAA